MPELWPSPNDSQHRRLYQAIPAGRMESCRQAVPCDGRSGRGCGDGRSKVNDETEGSYLLGNSRSFVGPQLLCGEGLPTGAASPLRIRFQHGSRTRTEATAFAGTERQYQLTATFGEPDFSLSDIEDCVPGISLGEDALLSWNDNRFSAAANRRQKRVRGKPTHFLPDCSGGLHRSVVIGSKQLGARATNK